MLTRPATHIVARVLKKDEKKKPPKFYEKLYASTICYLLNIAAITESMGHRFGKGKALT